MHASFGHVVRSIIRTGGLIALAMLLILGLFPAILAAQGRGH